MYILLRVDIMHRTQIYFEESLFEAIKKRADNMDLSISAYIRVTMAADLEQQKYKQQPVDFSDFAGMWQDYEIDQQNIREKAWK